MSWVNGGVGGGGGGGGDSSEFLEGAYASALQTPFLDISDLTSKFNPWNYMYVMPFY